MRGVPNVNVTVNVGKIEHGSLLAGKKILVTGGGRGLGYYMAKRFVEEGANVIITGRNKDNLKKAVEEIGNNCSYMVLDVSDVENITDNWNKLCSKYGQIDCLVNNAGISLHESNIFTVNIEGFEKQLDTNLLGGYFLAQQFLSDTNALNGKNILFISSERGYQCDDVPYGLIKASINSLTRGLAKRYSKYGARINALAPGVTASDMTGRKIDGNAFAEDQCGGRYFMPAEVAEVAVFLLSDASKCISGEVVTCDLGQYISSYY